MSWKVPFGLLFIVFVALTAMYANKSMIVYTTTSVDEARHSVKEENEMAITYSHPQNITRTYQDNYASIGGAIAFGIIAAASLLAFAITVKNENSQVKN
jgi:hypothetical protein